MARAKNRGEVMTSDHAWVTNDQMLESGQLPPFFVDWLDLRLTRLQTDEAAHAAAFRQGLKGDSFWIEPETVGEWYSFPIVGPVVWMGKDGNTRRRDHRATGERRQAFFWSRQQPGAFASLPGGWFLDAGWSMIRAYAELPGHKVEVQRIDYAFHLPQVDGLTVAEKNQATIQPFLSRGVFTGWVVGGSAGWMLRVYRKDIHDPEDHCEHRFPGLRDALPWRVELQMRAEWLKGRATTLQYLADPARAWSLVLWALDQWGVTLWETADGQKVPIRLPGQPGGWARTKQPLETARTALFAQARGCYITALLAGMGIYYLPSSSVRRAWAEELAPGIQDRFASFESEIEAVLDFHREKRP